MFIQQEDYNFLIYNTLVLLEYFKCYDEKSSFKDFRKIAYLVDLISSNKSLDDYNQDELGEIYFKAQIKKKLLSHILIMLRHKNYLGVSMNKTHRSFDIWLHKENIPPSFWDNERFELELGNIKDLQAKKLNLRTSIIKTLAINIFEKRNVLIWEI